MITDDTKEDEINALSNELSSIKITPDTKVSTSSDSIPVLIVDDDRKMNHKLATNMLKNLSASIEVTSVYSGEEAVENIKAGNKYKVILLDFEMGKNWNGEKTAEEIRKVDKDACIVTWSTVYTNNKKYKDADRSLSKPLKPQELRLLFEELKLLQKKPDPKSSAETNILSNAPASTQFGSSSLTNKPPITETPITQSTPTMEKKP